MLILLFNNVFLASVTKRKIALASDACFKTPIIITSRNLCAGDIKGAMGKITSYHKKLVISFCFGSYRLFIFWALFGLPFLSPYDGSDY
jgi:hypothetical protein